MRVIVVFVEPEKPINLGIIARLCRNFEVNELRIVNPEISNEDWKIAEIFASKAKDVLDRARIYDSLEEALKDVNLSIATSAIRRIRGGNIMRRAINVSELEEIISETDPGVLAVVLGRESSGLTNEEISKCDLLLSIDASEGYRTLNVACAAAIILHAIFTKRRKRLARKLADVKIRERIIKSFEEIVRVAIKDPKKAEKAIRAFSNVVNRGRPDHREATLILGILRMAADEVAAKYKGKEKA